MKKSSKTSKLVIHLTGLELNITISSFFRHSFGNGTKNNNTSFHIFQDHCYAFGLFLQPSCVQKRCLKERKFLLSWTHLRLAFVLMLRPFFPELDCHVHGLLSFEHPSVLLFCFALSWIRHSAYMAETPEHNVCSHEHLKIDFVMEPKRTI